MLALTTPFKERKTPGNYREISQIVKKNKSAGQHFFDADTKRFFLSRIGHKLYRGKYFITSEKFEHYSLKYGFISHPRKYTIRVAYEDGSIDTVGDFQQFDTRAAAEKVIGRLP